MDSRSEKTSSTTNTTTTGPRGRVILMSCGSYNPPTHMHLRMFERARDHLYNLGTHVVVGGVISPVSDAYSKKELASGSHRCEMLKLALQDSDWIRLSTWEIRQTEWTRTRCSLQHHQNILNSIALGHSDPNRNTIDNEDLEWIPESVRNNDQQQQDQTPVQIKLLCGGDLLESFATPGLWAEEDITEIVRQYGLIVITREGSNPYKFIYDSDVLSKHLHNIQIVTEWIPNEVSSSRIRRALKRGESVKYLLQDAVIDYVYMNGIYGANRPSTIDYLNVDEAKYHDHDNAFLTPSPSDITMKEQSPCDAYTATTTTTTTETATKTTETDVPDSVLQKNLHNNCSPRYSDDQSSTTNSIEDTELAREKFFRSLVNDSLHFGDESSSSLLPPTSRIFSQIDNSQLELPSSARARNELLAFEDTTESELATLCDNTYSEDREEDVLSITCEESSDDLNESSVRNNKDCNKEDCNSSDKANSEDTTSTTTKDGIDRNESLTYDNLEDSDSQATKFEANFEIDGKYLKSLVNLKKSPKKIDDDESIKSDKGDELKVESTPTMIGEEKTLEEKVEEETKKFFQDDISYIKRLRLIINNTPEENGKNQRQQLQGSLDSINLKETKTTLRNAMESMSKKSKSFESIKHNAPMSFKTSEISFCDTTISKLKSDSTSQLITAPEFDAQTDEFCSACCFATTTNEQPSSADVFYTLRSNSPGDEDSTECDICSSCNLRDSNEALDCKKATTTQTLSETTEICEICGEPATCTDEQLTDNTQVVVSSSRSMAVSLPKAKSTIEISRGSYRMSTLDDDQFEIDNCGLQDCKLRSSLDTCSKPEPLYVNIMPRHRQLISEIDCRTSSKFRTDHQLLSESERYNRAPGISFFGPKDEIAMSRSLSVSGAKRLSRKGSYAKKSGVDRSQEKRRYSSVDNLQNRMSFKSSGEKFSKSRDNKFMTSADSIRPRIARSRSLRRSADNVGRFDSSGDNLDSLEENVDTDENGTTTTTTASDGNKCARVKIRDSDTIKMILTKHGIKIISQKETVL